MKKVLSTKVMSNEVVKYAASLGFELNMMDVVGTSCIPFSVSSVHWDEFDSVVFTSANAVNCFFREGQNTGLLSDKKIICTSGKTATILAEKGYMSNIQGDNAKELAEKIIHSGNIHSTLHVCGNKVLETIGNELEKAKIRYTKLQVYNTTGIPNKKPAGNFEAILFFSPSGVESYLQYNEIEENELLCCVGDTTANSVHKYRLSSPILVADIPRPERMIELIKQYFN